MNDYRMPKLYVRPGGVKVIEFTVNDLPCTFVAVPYVTHAKLVEIAFGPAVDPRIRVGPVDYYGRSIGGGKLHKHESIHIENGMRFTVNKTERQ